MPAYGMPGVAISPRVARSTGLAMAATAAVVALVWQFTPTGTNPATMPVTVLTEHVGSGIQKGTDVRYDGVRIGKVEEIERLADGGQRLRLNLEKSHSAGLTDTLSMNYAPGNLFGISEVVLKSGSGGTPLERAGAVDLTGANAGRAVDATITALLNSLGELTNDVLTPELTGLLNRLASDTRAFAPLIQTIVTISQAVADTQRLPTPYLLTQYGNTLQGVPHTVSGLLDVLNAPFSNAYFAQPGKVEKYNANVNMIKDDALQAIVKALVSSRTYFSEYTGMLTPLLSAMAATVPRPEQSNAELSELLRRLNAAFADTPQGPTLQVAVALRATPGLAGPLAALAGPNAFSTEGPR
ncbi:MlaD family protein [Nocardia fluminea]|uniref:ABC-type transporter Mla subunit MlaD n=1 Tax=Nocardia fluminea TaxID=134984 RepID=A0A2N3VK75_9NOCA|nr:MlaD family protein [Nocardia fluminea]PKV82010.1 ABC-type transporter Mla subunit MlaD [Nocardia fluminea]